jgi:hypothetical protein
MNFKDLREANLSKAQIKKVHDKADDLPKNDFIKRYGKEGDAVRFATATNIVKKKLGIEDYEEGFKSDAQRRAAFASGYKEKGKKKDEAIKGNDFVGVSSSSIEYKQGKQAAKDGKKYDDNPYKSGNREMNIKRLNWSSGHNNFREELDDKDLTEGRVMIAVDKKTRKKWQFSDGMIVKHNGKQYKTEGVTTQQVLELTASFGTLKLGKKDIEAGFAKGNFSVVDDGSVYQPWKNDFEPEGEKELTEAVSDAYVKQIARMTDRNDHFGARFELARLMKDKQLMGFYDSLEKMHTTLPRGVIGNDAITIRQRLERLLRDRLKSKLKADADKLIDAL